MKVIHYLIRHNTFQTTMLMVLCVLVFMRIAFITPESFTIYTSGIIGYTLFPAFMFSWLSSFIQLFQNPSFHYRIKEQQDDILYFIKIMMICSCIYAVLIGFMMFMLNGVWINHALIALSLRNLICYIAVYAVATMLFITIYTRSFNMNKSFTITFISLVTYTMYMFYKGLFIDILLETSLLLKVILVCVVLFAIMLFIQLRKIRCNRKVKVSYILFGVLIFLQIRYGGCYDLHTAVTLDLINTFDFDAFTMIRYLLWITPKIVIFVDCSSLLFNYLKDNVKYFLIRSNVKSWFKLITKETGKMIGGYVLIHLMIFVLLNHQLMYPINDWLMFFHTYFSVYLLFEICSLLRILCKTDYVVIWILIVYICIHLFIIRAHAGNMLYTVFLLQNFDTSIFLVEVSASVVLYFCSIQTLQKMKD